MTGNGTAADDQDTPDGATTGANVTGAYVGDLGGSPAGLLAAMGSIGAQVGELTSRIERLDTVTKGAWKEIHGLKALREEVAKLAAAITELATNSGAAEATDDQPHPIDLAHLPATAPERLSALSDLAGWVGQILLPGWPSARERLPHCWPLHADIVNDLLLLRSAYEAAYDDPFARAQHAADFRRWLGDVLHDAEARAVDCPTWNEHQAGHRHPVAMPARDETTWIAAAVDGDRPAQLHDRPGQLAQLHDLLERANDPDHPDAAAGEAANTLVATAGITQEEYQQWRARLRESGEQASATAANRRPRRVD